MTAREAGLSDCEHKWRTLTFAFGEKLLKVNTEENVILLIIYSLDAGMSVDTEDAVVSEHLINGNKAMGVVKGNDSTLIWSTDQYSVTLTGVIPLEELTHIAEGMIF